MHWLLSYIGRNISFSLLQENKLFLFMENHFSFSIYPVRENLRQKDVNLFSLKEIWL